MIHLTFGGTMHIFKKGQLLFLACVFFTNTLSAQDLSLLHAFSGAAADHVRYHEGHLYVAAGHTLMVKHQRGEEHPYPETFRRRFVSTITELVVHNGYLYLAANHDGLYKFDIADPAVPVEHARYELDGIDEAAYDIAFKGDSVFLACRTRAKVLLDEGNIFSHLADFAEQSGNSLTRGGEILDNLYLMGQGFGNANDGIYIFDAITLQELGFHHQSFGEPEEILLGEPEGVVHVLGGTRSWTNPADPRGLIYSLDVSNPSDPHLLFTDTLNGFPFGLGIASPVDAIIHNDTLFVATTCARDTEWILGEPATGQVYVYDVADTANIHRAETLYGGLWHFGVDIHDDTLFVASEWYGVLSLDISDIHNEHEIGRTLTGGWNTSAASHNGRLAMPYGGYGFEVHNISDPSNPVLEGVNYDGNFVRSLEWSDDGAYLFGFYVTGEKFRVFDANTLQQVSSIPNDVGWRRTWRWQDLIGVKREATLGATKLSLINVSDPLLPEVDTSFNYNFNDMAINANGLLFVSHNDSLSVFSVDGGLQFITSLHNDAWWNDFKALAVHGDTAYCWVSGQGLTRYLFTGSELQEVAVHQLDHDAPEYMAVDANGLYMSVLQQGLYAHNLETMAETGYYQHGLEYLSTGHWGVWDLIAEDGLIFLCEWHGNTSIFGNDNGLAVIDMTEETELSIFPNPSNGTFRIDGAYGNEMLELYDLKGKLVLSQELQRGYNVVFSQLVAGVYLLKIGKHSAKVLITGKK